MSTSATGPPAGATSTHPAPSGGGSVWAPRSRAPTLTRAEGVCVARAKAPFAPCPDFHLSGAPSAPRASTKAHAEGGRGQTRRGRGPQKPNFWDRRPGIVSDDPSAGDGAARRGRDGTRPVPWTRQAPGGRNPGLGSAPRGTSRRVPYALQPGSTPRGPPEFPPDPLPRRDRRDAPGLAASAASEPGASARASEPRSRPGRRAPAGARATLTAARAASRAGRSERAAQAGVRAGAGRGRGRGLEAGRGRAGGGARRLRLPAPPAARGRGPPARPGLGPARGRPPSGFCPSLASLGAPRPRSLLGSPSFSPGSSR